MELVVTFILSVSQVLQRWETGYSHVLRSLVFRIEDDQVYALAETAQEKNIIAAASAQAHDL